MEKIRWGVIGSGGIARRRTIPEGIVPASNAALAAVYDIDAAVNREVARQFGAAAAESLEALLGAGIDAVYVATPVDCHRAHVEACARARKPVLCEKPLGLNAADAEAAVRACREAGVALGVAYMMRFHAQHQAALRMIREGRLGKPVFARAQLSCWYPPIEGAWRQDPARGGGGSLVDLGGHCLDLLEMFFGPVARVACFARSTVHGYAPEDSAVALLEFANGALGAVDAFFCVRDESSRNALELYGSRGGILASGTLGQSGRGEMTVFEGAGGAYDARQGRGAAAGRPVDPEPVNLYRAEIEEFGRALLEGRSSSLDGEIGLRSQRVLAACYESARTGRAVALSV